MATARPALLSLLIATSCVGGTITATPTPAPTASPSAAPSVAAASPTPSPSASPTATPTASPTLSPRATPTYPPPAADTAAGIGQIRSLTARAVAADGSRVVGLRQVGTVTPASFDVIDVGSGQRRTIAHSRVGMVQGATLAAGDLVYFDQATGADGKETLGVWRMDLTLVSPAPVRVDEFPMPGGFGGGDTINPWPWPRTNGRDLVWLRTRDAGATRTHEIVLGTGIGPGRVIHSGPSIPFYALGADGRVAIVTTTDKEAALSVYDGRLREIAQRPVAQGGLPSWVQGRIAWFDSFFNVRPASLADLYDPSSAAVTPFAPPPGCGLLYPTTRRHVIVMCFGGLAAAHDIATGRIAPLAPLVIPNTEGLLMRSTAEFAAGESAWLHAAVLPP